MKTNEMFIRLARLMLIICGGILTLHYVQTGDLLLDQVIGASIGLILLAVSLVWKASNKKDKQFT